MRKKRGSLAMRHPAGAVSRDSRLDVALRGLRWRRTLQAVARHLGNLRNGSQDRWFVTLGQLAKSFEDVCGDTFCEGDYDLSALSIFCSVSSGGIVTQCAWVFIGSYSNISTKTGALGLKRKMFSCRLPLARGTTVLAVTGNDDPIQSPLPGAPDLIMNPAPQATAQEALLVSMLKHGDGDPIEPRRSLALTRVTNWPVSCVKCESEAVKLVSRRLKDDGYA